MVRVVHAMTGVHRILDRSIYCSYIKLKIEFDPYKDAFNLAKHGVTLAAAIELDWEAALVWVDDRCEYGEVRMIALAPRSDVLYYTAFVDRGCVRRIISLRRANRREVNHYVRTNQTQDRRDADG